MDPALAEAHTILLGLTMAAESCSSTCSVFSNAKCQVFRITNSATTPAWRVPHHLQVKLEFGNRSSNAKNVGVSDLNLAAIKIESDEIDAALVHLITLALKIKLQSFLNCNCSLIIPK